MSKKEKAFEINTITLKELMESDTPPAPVDDDSFILWLGEMEKDDSVIGDLAQDVLRDNRVRLQNDRSKEAKSYNEIRFRLDLYGADTMVYDALDEAFNLFCKEKKGGKGKKGVE